MKYGCNHAECTKKETVMGYREETRSVWPNFCFGLKNRKNKRKYRTDRFHRGVTNKARPFLIFFFSPHTVVIKSALNIEVSIYTVRCTQNSRDRKRWRERRAAKVETPNYSTPSSFLWETMWRFVLCCCCSNNTISTSFLPLLAKYQDSVAAVAEQRPLVQCLVSPAMLAACFYFSLLTGNRHRKVFEQKQHWKWVFTLWATPSWTHRGSPRLRQIKEQSTPDVCNGWTQWTDSGVALYL